MTVRSEPDTQAGIGQLMNGILADAQDLLRQQLALFRLEVQGELRKAKEAGALMAAGAVIAVAGLLLLCFMAVHLLSWIAPQLPLWVCYGLIGAPFALLGAVLCVSGLRKFNTVSAPREQPLPALRARSRSFEENVDG